MIRIFSVFSDPSGCRAPTWLSRGQGQLLSRVPVSRYRKFKALSQLQQMHRQLRPPLRLAQQLRRRRKLLLLFHDALYRHHLVSLRHWDYFAKYVLHVNFSSSVLDNKGVNF